MTDPTVALIALASTRPATPDTVLRGRSFAGLMLVVLAHVAVVLLLLQPSAQAPLTPDGEPVSERLITVFAINLPTEADQRSAAPTLAAARPERRRPVARQPRPASAAPPPSAAPASTEPKPPTAVPSATLTQPTAELAIPDAVPSAPPSADPADTAAHQVPSPGEIDPNRPAPRAGEADRLARQYAGVISRTISSSQKWPLMARQHGETGTAWVRLKLARDGRVIDATLIRPTGYPRLDEEARAVIFRIGRFMPVPTRLRPDQDYLLLDQPMRFGPG